MAIRDAAAKGPTILPGGGPAGAAPTPAQPGALPPVLERALQEAGLLQAGKKPADAAQALLSSLAQRGFQAPPGFKGDLAAQLMLALKAFQAQAQLPASGRLDAATTQALKAGGLLNPPETAQPGRTLERDGFERLAPSLLKQGERPRQEPLHASTPDTNFLDALLNQLGPGGPSEGMSAVDVRAAAEAGHAAPQTVDKKQLSAAEAKRGEGFQKEKGSATEGPREGPEAPMFQGLDKGSAVGVKVSRGLKSESTRTEEKKRRDVLGTKDPTELGLLEEEADEDALEGAGQDGNKRGRGGTHDGGGDGGEPEEGAERERGNAQSGDENFQDTSRGHAQLDDGSGAEPGHTRIPSLSEQVFAALDKIARDAAQENRATTYSWDVTFFAPGVYAPGQKAQELVHLVVDKATAFDPVWAKAQANLASLIKRADPHGRAPTLEDLIQALRLARARLGDESATGLKRVTRPPGRA